MNNDPMNGVPTTDASAGSTRHTPWYLQAWTGIAIVVVVAAVTGVVTWAVIVSGRPQARAGALFETNGELVPAHTATVQLPWGLLDLGVTEARTSLPRDVARYVVGQNPELPDGGHFLGVHWAVGTGVADSGEASIRSLPQLPTLVSLTVGTHSYPLYSAGSAHGYCDSICLLPESNNSTWIAVRGDVGRAGFTVTYDGVTQTVDAATGTVHRGRAAPLYSAGRTTKPACSAATVSPGFTARQGTCTVTTTRTAYVRGLGWTKAGSQWVVVKPSVSGPYGLSYRAKGRTFSDLVTFYGSQSATYRLAGRAPAFQGPQQAAGALGPDVDYASDDLLVFSVPAGSSVPGPLTMSLRFVLDLDADEAGAVPTSFTATWSVAS